MALVFGMRTMKPVPALVALAMALTAPLAAQPRVAFDVRGGVAAPLGSFKQGGDLARSLDPGLSYAVTLQIQRSASRAAFIGFSEHRFGCGEAACGARDFVSTGWLLGTRLNLGSGASTPWVRLAMVFDRSEAGIVVGGAPDRIVSDQALGGEAGIGMTIATRKASITPGLRYALHDARFPDVGLVKVRYLVLDVGVLLGF
jgi:hypothetical protein